MKMVKLPRGILFWLLAIILLAIGASGQVVDGDRVVVTPYGEFGHLPPVWLVSQPEVAVPDEAKASGLGGTVQVRVTVGQTGVVLEAEVIGGPEPMCPTTTRADVVALRRTADDAARRATFRPFVGDQQPQEQTAFLAFEFPRGHSRQNELRMISGGVLNGKASQLAQPEYPPAARAVRASGDVNVKVVIDTDGSVFSADASSGHPLLKHASEVAACDSRFSPTLLQGVPVRISGVIVYNFGP